MKFISLITLICFFISNVCGIISADMLLTSNISYTKTNNAKEIITNCDMFSKYAQVTFSSYKKNTPLVVIINDLHNNSNAQSNIEQIISFFKNNSNLDKIILEGAPNKKINIELFNSMDKTAVVDIVDGMLSGGNISGAEAFIVKNNVSDSYGLENWSLYLENIKKNIVLKNKYDNDISYLLNSFVKIRINYPKTKLLDAFTYTNDTNERVKKIIKFCNEHNIDLTLYPQLEKFELIKKYKNEKNLKKDFNNLLTELKANISYENYSYIVNVLKNSTDNPKYAMSVIFKIVKETSPKLLLKYKFLLSYLKNINRQNSINYYLLFNELEILERYVLNKFSGKQEKELVEVDKFIHLLSEYSNLSLTYQNYKYLVENKNYLYMTAIKYLDFKSVEIINDILDDSELEKYYEINLQRNNIFYKNLSNLLNLKSRKVTKENKDILNNLEEIKSVNIVVVGGFHNQLTDMLKQEDVSVLSVIPNISNLTLLDNQMLRVNNIVYQSALAPPMVCVRTDLYSLAVIINSWANAMAKRNIPLQKQFDIILSWLNKNNIKVDFEINPDSQIILNSKPIEEILVQTQEERKNMEVKHKKLFNFLWSLNNLKLKIYSYFLVAKYTFGMVFGYEYIQNQVQDKKDNLKVKDMFINTEYQKTVDSINGEMPDVIIITLDDKDDEEFCRKEIDYLLKDKDVHVEYRRKEENVDSLTGSAAGFVDAMDCLKNNLHLDKSYDKLKTVVIDIPHEDINLIKQELPFPFKDKNLTPLQLALLNGIRSCNKFGDDGGIAFMEARSIYIGAMNLTGDLTFISSVVNMEEIEKHNLALIIKNDEDRSKIEKFYYGFKPDDITDVVEKRGIATKNFYNFNNRKLEQFEVITGNMLIHFNDNNKYKQFIDFMTDMKPAMITASKKKENKERISILKHLFKPYLRLSREESHKTDLARNTDMSLQEQIDFFDFYTDELEKNYKKRKDSLKSVKFGIFNHYYSSYTRNSTNDTLAELSKIIKQDIADTDSYKPDSENSFELIEIHEETLSNDSVLKRTYEILKQINGNPFEENKDYDQIIDILMEIFRTTYFQEELYTVESENTAKLYRLISSIISSSINNINEQISKAEDNKGRQNLENLKQSLLVMQEYTIEYLRLLDYTSTLATLCGYIYPERSIFEIAKIMPVNRVIFGFTRGIKNAKIDIRNQMRKVQYLGNNKLMYSLYPDETLEDDIENFIEKSENPREKTAIGMQPEWGTRRALQRFSNIITALQSVVATAFVAVMKSAITAADISSMVQFLLTGLVPPVFLHRALIWVGWKNNFYDKKKEQINVEFFNMKIQRNSAELFIQKKKPFNELDKILSRLLKDENLNDEIIELIEENKELIKHYHEFYNLKTLSKILDNNKQILKLLPNDNSLKKQLETFTNEHSDILNELTINYKQEKQKQVQEKKFETPKQIRQQKIEAIFEDWEDIKYLTDENLDNIINYSIEIIKKTSFNKRSLKGNNKDELIDVLQRAIALYNKTFEMFYSLSIDEQERFKKNFKDELNLLNKMGEYTVKYYKALNYLVTLETLYYYRISESNKMHFWETFKIAAAIRYLFGINLGIYLSEKNLLATMKEVKKLGNDIMGNGFYNDKFEKNIDYFIEKNKNPKYFDLGINESWRARKMLSRLVPTILFVQKILIAITTNSFSIRALSISFATGVGLTILLHWVPILVGFIKTMRIKWKKQYKTEKIENIRNSLSQKYLKNLAEVPYGEMPDLILVTGNKQQYKDEQTLRNVIKDISGDGNFANVPIEVSVTENKGDGSSIINAFNSLKNNPLLYGKNLQDLKIAIVNVDGAKSEDITKPLGFEIIKGREATAVELAFLNAVGMLQTNKTDKGNIVIADPSYLYLGNLYQEENITILGTDIEYRQLEEQNLPLLVADEDNKGIYKIFNKFNISKINNTVVRESYSKRYDMAENPLIKLPAYSGLVGVNIDNFNNDELFELFETAKNYVENYEGEKEEIDFVAHILIPILRIINNEDIDAYLEVLKKEAIDEQGNIDNEKRNNIDKFYRGLFKNFAEFLEEKNLDSIVNLKVEHSSMMTKNQDDGFYDDFVSVLSSLQNDDDINIFDISNEKIKFNDISVIATIDFNNFSPEQLEEILDNLPVEKIIINNAFIDTNKKLYNVDFVEIDIEDNQFDNNPEYEKFKTDLKQHSIIQDEYFYRKQYISYKKYQKILDILNKKTIEQIDEPDEDYYNLQLSDEDFYENIEDTLLNISNNNNGSLKISLDISNLFNDNELENNFNKLIEIIGTADGKILPIYDNDEYVEQEYINDIVDIEQTNNILCCA